MLVDPFQRTIDYVRISVTDRCDFRCVYCMAENMTFLPKSNVLSLEELMLLCQSFITLGFRRIRLTGGEPLVRKDIIHFISDLGRQLGSHAFNELTLTTNGSQLAKYADRLARFGVKRINVSLDTLDAGQFTKITRWGRLEKVLNGLKAAKAAGLSVKINTVALKHANQHELVDMAAWAHNQGFDITFIETMPLGDIDEDRTDQYLPLTQVRTALHRAFILEDIPYKTGGPARYTRSRKTGGKIGFITPMTHNFCESCNRVRITCTGTMYMCLGQSDKAELMPAIRSGQSTQIIADAIRKAIRLKPKGHDFVIDRERSPKLARFMSTTGG